MNYKAERYLQEVNRGLSGIPQQDREDILLEIQNHIYEATQKGEEPAQILARLGAPAKLAQAYAVGYRAEYQQLKPRDILNTIAFYGIAGLSGVIVIPTLGILTIVLMAAVIAIPGIAITNLLGITREAMFVFGRNSVPIGPWQLLLAVGTSIVFFLLVRLCWSGLKKYVRAISEKYRKLKLCR